MDTQLQAFTQNGLAAAVTAWDHQVIVTTSAAGVTPVTTVTLHGVQSNVEVDRESLQQFGFAIKRVFSIVIKKADFDTNSLTVGMKGVEQSTGEICRFLYLQKDFLGVHLFFGSTNQ